MSVILSVFSLRNDDVGFHIAAGDWIRSHGEVPLENPFSYANDGARWTQHQWIPAVCFSWLEDMGGAAALVIWKALMIGLIFLVVSFSLLRSLSDPWRVAPILAVAIAASTFRFYVRPYLFSILALALTVLALLEWRKKADDRRWLWVAMFVPVVAVHLHAGGLYTFLVWGAFVASMGVRQFLSPHFGLTSPDISFSKGMMAMGAMVLMAVGSLLVLAPSGIEVLLLPLRMSGNEYWYDHLVEFRPMSLRVELLGAWLAMAMALAGCVYAVVRRRLFELFLLLGFGYLAFRHMRLVFPMAVVCAMAFGSVWRLSDSMRIGRRWLIPLLSAALSVMVLGWAWVDQSGRFEMGIVEDAIDDSRVPLKMMDIAASMPGEVMVSDAFAGTWLWRYYREEDESGHSLPLQDRRRVLIHNDLECYEQSTYVDVYQHIRYGLEGWEKKVADLGIQTFVLKHTSPGEKERQGGKPNLRWHLFLSPDWSLIDFDDVASVYVRADRVPEQTASYPAFPVDPDSWKARRESFSSVAEQQADYARIQQALLAHSRRHPTQVRALVILGQYAAMARDLDTLAAATKEVIRRQPQSPYVSTLRELVGKLADKS